MANNASHPDNQIAIVRPLGHCSLAMSERKHAIDTGNCTGYRQCQQMSWLPIGCLPDSARGDCEEQDEGSERIRVVDKWLC
jgi:hypothetical protein